MGLNKETYHLIGSKPRVYCDVIQYFKAIGKKYVSRKYWADESGSSVYSTGSDDWDMNPSKIVPTEIKSLSHQGDWYYLVQWIQFGEVVDESYASGDDAVIVPLSPELKKLLYTVNYYGVLGQNLGATLNNNKYNHNFLLNYPDTSYHWLADSIIGEQSGNHCGMNGDGTFLAKVHTIQGTPDVNDLSLWNGYRIDLRLTATDESEQLGKLAEIGSFTVGHYFDLNAPDLTTTVTIDYSSIKKKRTMSGGDLINIEAYKPSDWGRYKPFTTTKEPVFLDDTTQDGVPDVYAPFGDFTDVGLNGRRIIDMKFSMMSESDTFPKNMHQNTFVQDKYLDEGQYSGFDYDTATHTPNILGNYLNITLGGNITHILQLDSTVNSEGNMANDFVLVKLDGKATQIAQTAPRLYDCRLRFVEQF